MSLNTNSERKIDEIDAALAMNRQSLILEMINDGRIDPEEGIKMFEEQLSIKTVNEERTALDNNTLGEPGTPSGQITTLFLKLSGRKKLIKFI